MELKERVLQIRSFLKRIHGEQDGYVYVPYLDGDTMHPQGFKNPSGRDQHVKAIAAYCPFRTSYYSPALYHQKGNNTRANFRYTKFLWLDVDHDNGPKVLDVLRNGSSVPEPSIVIQSSTVGNLHLYWELEEWLDDINVVERLNKGIAHSVGIDLVDKTSWDGGQLLRIPGTYNLKTSQKHKVQVRSDNAGVAFNLSKFPIDLKPTESKFEHIVDIDFNNLPDYDKVLAQHKLSSEILSNLTLEYPRDRSGKLYRIGHDLVEQTNMVDAEIFAILLNRDNFWGKFEGRANQHSELSKIILKARNKAIRETKLEEPFPALTGYDLRVINTIRPQYIFDGMIAEKRILTLFGDPAVGKTRIAIQMAVCGMLGHDFLGFHFNDTVTVRPMLLTMEMTPDQVHQYYEYLLMNFDEKEQDRLLREFIFIPQLEETNLWFRDHQQYLVNRIQEHKTNFVIIDSMITSGGEGDNTRSYYNFVNLLKQRLKCGVLLVSHNRKESQDSPRKSNRLSDLFGSYEHSARVDDVIAVDRVKGTKDITISNLKSRDHSLFDTFKVEDTAGFWFKRAEDKEAESNDGPGDEPINKLNV